LVSAPESLTNIITVGEVRIKKWSTIWYNCVVRGDINRVDIHNFTSVGDGTVIATAAALPTGMPAKTYIGRNCVIGRGCSLYSCHIEDDVTIGDKCVILEGARIEKGAQLAPGSVVPPGRLIPAKQFWGGNPVSFIKDLDIGEVWHNYSKSYIEVTLADAHKNEFTLWNSAYLHRQSSETDV
jgi:gamma-carbonic anhydrase